MGACTEFLGPSIIASTSNRAYSSVDKDRVLAESLHLKTKHFFSVNCLNTDKSSNFRERLIFIKVIIVSYPGDRTNRR